MLNIFPDLFAKNPRAPRECLAVSHVIKGNDERPSKCKVRRIPQKWVNDVNIQVDEMLNNSIITHSSSPYNSNPLLVSKKDGVIVLLLTFGN